MGEIARGEGLTLREAAAAVGLSMGTLRGHIRAGRLAAGQEVGKYGPEYRIRPVVLSTFAADRLGLKLDAAALRRRQQGQGGEPLGGDMRDLYERLLAVTADATRYKALAEVSESARAEAEREYHAQIAELRHERDTVAEQAAAAQAEAEAATAKAEAEAMKAAEAERAAARAEAQAEAAGGELERLREREAELRRLQQRGFWARVFGGRE